MLVFPQKNNVVLAEGLEPTCDQLPFLQGISLRGYARMVLCIYSIHISVFSNKIIIVITFNFFKSTHCI